jgi:peroxiredoxin
MHLRLNLLPALLVVVLALFPISGSSASADETLYDFASAPHVLKEHLGKGKWLIVTVWASDCAVCNQEIPEMVAFHNARRDIDATVLGISVDGPGGKQEALAFIERHQVSFPNLLDHGRAFKAIYLRATGRPWLGGTPMNLVYAPDGRLAARRIGPLAKAELEAFIEKESKN